MKEGNWDQVTAELLMFALYCFAIDFVAHLTYNCKSLKLNPFWYLVKGFFYQNSKTYWKHDYKEFIITGITSN